VNPLTNVVYVSYLTSGSVSVIDGATNTEKATIPIADGDQSDALVLNPSTNMIYVTTDTGVSVIDGDTNAITATINGVQASAVNLSTGILYGNSSGTSDVVSINGGTNSVTDMTGVMGYTVAVNSSTNLVYVFNEADNCDNNTISVVNGSTNAVTATIAIGCTYISTAAVNPLTNTIYVPDQGGNAVSVINGATNTVTPALSATGVLFNTAALGVGTHSITAQYSGDANWPAATSPVLSQIVNQATPTLAFSAISNQIYGVAPFGVNASSASTGAITYSVSSGPATISGSTVTITGVGTVTLGASQAAAGNYAAATAQASFTVISTPTVTWSTPAPITAGTALSATQLDATANVPGIFTYFPGPGTVLAAGTHTLQTTFSPTGITGATVTATVSLIVNSDQSGQNTPVISWPTPAAISYGTALSTTQLNASASYNGTSVPGTFEYTPSAGEVLDPGSQTLLVNFFPADSVHYNTAGGSVILQVNTSSTQPLNIYSYSITGYAPNSNLLNYTDCVPGTGNCVTGTWSFNYDSLNRVVSGAPTAGNYAGQNLCWSYDAFGNRTTQTTQSTTCPTLPTVPAQTVYYNTSNQVTGGSLSYDAAGNVTVDNTTGNSYIYDAEGRICAVKSEPVSGTYSMTAYVYDAEGNRVAKGALSSWPTNNLCPNLAAAGVFTPTNSYVLGLSGEQLTETDGNGNWIHSNVYAAGMLIATYDMAPTGTPALHFQLQDWLGSRRVQTDIAGNPEETFSNLPFGDGFTTTPASGAPSTADDATEHHFTGKERDTESGLDYFGARYYGSSMGRFMSADNGEDQDMQNPQSWNLYSYVQNNPLTNTDPDGHDCIDTSNFSKDGTVTITTGDSCANNLGPNGTYVNGTINQNSITANVSASGTTFGYDFTSYDGQSGGAGVIAQAPAYGPLEGPANLAGANMIGNGGMAAIKDFAIGSAVGGLLGGAALTAAGTEAGLSILTENLEGVLSRASSAVGNQGAKVASREVAEEAAKKWVGEGAREITDRGTGQVIGEISADGTKVARFTSAETKGYINLVNKLTGGNLHVGW
jgi:RHS repeat-associated protein